MLAHLIIATFFSYNCLAQELQRASVSWDVPDCAGTPIWSGTLELSLDRCFKRRVDLGVWDESVMSNAKFECVSDSANSRLRAVYYNDQECTSPSAEAAQEFVSGECLNFEDFSYKIYFDCSTRVAPSNFEKRENGFQSQYLVHFNEAEKTTRTEDCSGTFTSPRYGWGKLDTMCHKYYYLENHITEGYTQQCVGDNVETKLYSTTTCDNVYMTYTYSPEGTCSEGRTTQSLTGCSADSNSSDSLSLISLILVTVLALFS